MTTRFRVSKPFDLEDKEQRHITFDGIQVGSIVTLTDISNPNFYEFEPSSAGTKLYNLLNRFISYKYWDTVDVAGKEIRRCLIEEDNLQKVDILRQRVKV